MTKCTRHQQRGFFKQPPSDSFFFNQQTQWELHNSSRGMMKVNWGDHKGLNPVESHLPLVTVNRKAGNTRTFTHITSLFLSLKVSIFPIWTSLLFSLMCLHVSETESLNTWRHTSSTDLVRSTRQTKLTFLQRLTNDRHVTR